MSRPKSPYVGIGTFALAAVNTRKLSKMRSEFERINSDQASNLEVVGSNLKSLGGQLNDIRDLHVASLSGVFALSGQLQELSKSSWEILEFLKYEDRREDILGNLKLFLINTEEELEKINNLTEEYPEYALLLASNLHELLEHEGVEIEHFKRMPSTADIKWAKSVLDSVERTFAQLKDKVLR